MKFVLSMGNTETARIDGISAAGATPDLMLHTPSADAEILTYGQPTQAPVVPVSPTGCPTPAVVSRAARELVEFDSVVINAGATKPTTAPTVDVSVAPGRDIRNPIAVPDAREIFDSAREFGASLPDMQLVIGETIPGGTTTAMGVLTALGEPPAVSSSLPENPLELKRTVVAEGLDASGLGEGEAAGDPIEAVRAVGDPVLTAIAGLTIGALETGATVTLGGGTQMSAAAALVRHFGVEERFAQATTSFIAEDNTANVEKLADILDLDLIITDPEFARTDHPAMNAYVHGEAKEGVGMGGALALLMGELTNVPAIATSDLHERIITVYDRLIADAPEDHPASI